MKNVIKFAMIAVFAMSLSACGKAAKPIPHEGSGYPHSYPRNVE